MITAEKLGQEMHAAIGTGTWPELPKELRQRYIQGAAKLLAGPLRPIVNMGPVAGANVHTYIRRPKRVQAYLYLGTPEDASELNALLRVEGDQAFFNLTNAEGDFLMEEGIEPGQWLCVVTATGETYVVDVAELRREYEPGRRV